MKKLKIRKMLALGCTCMMLFSATAFAAPLGEDADVVSSNSAITANVSDGATGSGLVDPPLDDSFIAREPSLAFASVSEVQVVAMKDCKMYSSASTSSTVVGTMPKGTVRMVQSISKNFYKVIMDGDNVWVHTNNLADATNVTISITASKTCNVYKSASSSSTVVTTIPSGTTRTVLNTSGNFYKIKMNGELGWVKMSTGNFSISISGHALTTYEKIAELSKMQVGKSYVWGAEGPDTFDCSGLAQYCYNQYGITSIPRVSSDQYSSSTKVSKSNLKPGYLIFFHTVSGSNAVSHVGIYIGENTFVHAANSSTGVIVSSLSSYSDSVVGYGYY